MLLWTFKYVLSFGEHVYTFLLGINLGVELLGHKEMHMVIFNKSFQFSIVMVPIYTYTMYAWEF